MVDNPSFEGAEMSGNSSVESLNRSGIAVLALCGVGLGLAEIILSAIMRSAGLPYRSVILAGLGMGIMALALAVYRRTTAILAVAALAALAKALAIPVFQMPFFCNANAYLAVLLNGAALAGLAAVGRGRMDRSRLLQSATGAGAALAGVGLFYLLGMYVQPCRPLLNVGAVGGWLVYLAAKGLPAALASALMLPAGYALGRRLREISPPAWTQQGSVGYPVSAAVLVSCWLLNGLLVA
jgi:hypothetical protein